MDQDDEITITDFLRINKGAAKAIGDALVAQHNGTITARNAYEVSDVYLVILDGYFDVYGVSKSILGIYSSEEEANNAIHRSWEIVKERISESTKRSKEVAQFYGFSSKFPTTEEKFKMLFEVKKIPLNKTYEIVGTDDIWEWSTEMYIGGYAE